TPEYRIADRDVVEMPGGLPGVVGDEHVTGPERLERVRGQEVLHGQGHRVDVPGGAGDRLGDHVAAPIEDPRGEVARLAHDRGERRAHERGRLLVDHSDQAVPADVERDRIHHGASAPAGSAIRVWCGSTVIAAPGPMTVVDSRSSTMTV